MIVPAERWLELREIANSVQGAANMNDEFLAEFSLEECRVFDQMVFSCEGCGWWCCEAEKNDLPRGWFCNDCVADEKE